jgi:hypothetical protein
MLRDPFNPRGIEMLLIGATSPLYGIVHRLAENAWKRRSAPVLAWANRRAVEAAEYAAAEAGENANGGHANGGHANGGHANGGHANGGHANGGVPSNANRNKIKLQIPRKTNTRRRTSYFHLPSSANYNHTRWALL